MKKIKKKSNNSDTVKIPIKNPWAIATILLAILCLFLIYNSSYMQTKNTESISGDQAGQKLVNFLNARSDEENLIYVSSTDLGDLYEITVNFKGDNVPIYTTKDGQYFIQTIIPLP